jgi:hypothetical protein
LWGINVVVEELEYKVVSGVGNREILRKYLEQAFVFTIVGISLELEEITE